MSQANSTLTIHGTNFEIISDRHDALGFDRISHAVSKAWPEYYEIFGMQLPQVKIHDIDAPIGGGPQGLFEIGIYSAAQIDESVGDYIKQAIGWEPLKSTSDYINVHYARFADPTQAYVDDMVIHELGHLFFGWGLTKAAAFTLEDAWFALGLGIVYDRIVWNKFYSESSPLFSSVENLWRHHFAGIQSIDQRLIGPNVANDEMYGLNRIQTYGHGKAAVFLEALRETVGETIFDDHTRRYLKRDNSNSIIYDEFLATFDDSDRRKIESMELAYGIR